MQYKLPVAEARGCIVQSVYSCGKKFTLRKTVVCLQTDGRQPVGLSVRSMRWHACSLSLWVVWLAASTRVVWLTGHAALRYYVDNMQTNQPLNASLPSTLADDVIAKRLIMIRKRWCVVGQKHVSLVSHALSSATSPFSRVDWKWTTWKWRTKWRQGAKLQENKQF